MRGLVLRGWGNQLPEDGKRMSDGKMEAKDMGENFYRDLAEFRAKYPTREEKEQALRGMSAEKILQLARSCGTLQDACFYARFAQAAAERNG